MKSEIDVSRQVMLHVAESVVETASDDLENVEEVTVDAVCKDTHDELNISIKLKKSETFKESSMTSKDIPELAIKGMQEVEKSIIEY